VRGGAMGGTDHVHSTRSENDLRAAEDLRSYTVAAGSPLGEEKWWRVQ
jgi:hypothetical protein